MKVLNAKFLLKRYFLLWLKDPFKQLLNFLYEFFEYKILLYKNWFFYWVYVKNILSNNNLLSIVNVLIVRSFYKTIFFSFLWICWDNIRKKHLIFNYKFVEYKILLYKNWFFYWVYVKNILSNNNLLSIVNVLIVRSFYKTIFFSFLWICWDNIRKKHLIFNYKFVEYKILLYKNWFFLLGICKKYSFK